MNREAHPWRTGRQPLALHLAAEIFALMSSMAALPLLRNGSLSWNPNLQPLATELMKRIAQTTPDAFTGVLRAEAQARFNAFTHGIHLYQKSPRSERLKEPPVVWQSGVAKLLDFGATHENAAEGSPILVVPSLINRGYVLDLTDKLSLLRDLAKRGFRPMLMDWGHPGEVERAFALEDYITGPLQGAFNQVQEISGRDPALLGYCMGGTLALALASRNPGQIAAMALLATPWDFQAGQEGHLPALAAMAPGLEAVIHALGVLPTDILQAMFAGLNPGGVSAKYRGLAGLKPGSAKARDFVALEDWLNDGVPLAGPVARECLFDWYLANTPAKRKWKVAGEVVDPAKTETAALVVVPSSDYIVPPESAKPLAGLLPHARLKTVKAGHIGMVAGGRARSILYTPLGKWFEETIT